MKSNFFIALVLGVGLVASCEKEEVKSPENTPAQESIPKQLASGWASNVEYLESATFRSEIDEFGLVELASANHHIEVNNHNDVDILEDEGPAGFVIRIICTNSNLPNGVYFLDLCDGAIYDITGGFVGNASGIFGEGLDCD